MENDFFKKPFLSGNKKIVVPEEEDQQFIHQKIVDEIENGIVKQDTKEAFLKIINKLSRKSSLTD